MKIYLIEDEKSIRDTLKVYLETLGHQVVAEMEPFMCSVYHGSNCPKEKACADALIIDFHLPKLNGLAFIEMLKDRGCKGVTSNVLLMSGDTSSIDRAKAEELGCTVVQKPMRFNFVREWLENIK